MCIGWLINMKKYCIYCGTPNKKKDQNCKKCGKTLNPKKHLFKEYLFKHIRSNLVDGVRDNIFSLLTNFIRSHLYGTIMTVAVISTITAGVVNVVNHNSNIEKVTSKPEVEFRVLDLDINSKQVIDLYQYVGMNDERYTNTGFYEDRLIKYDDLKEEDKILLIYLTRDFDNNTISVNTCDDLQGFDDIYHSCVADPDYILVGNTFWRVDTNSFLNKYRNVFGSNRNFARRTYWVLARNCEFNEKDEMLCYTLPQGFMSGSYEYTKMIKAEKVGNNINIYDRFIMLGYFETIDRSYYGTYKDPAMTIQIADKPDENLVMEGQLYKHVYKLDKNGNYYWYSSEPVDEIA